jgi:hypothetical protein
VLEADQAQIPSGPESLQRYMDSRDRLRGRMNEFKICLSSLHVLRYLVDHRSSCPLSLSARLFRHHDTLVQITSLIEAAPWVRTNNLSRLCEKWHEGEWRQFTNELSTVEGNCWISILSLVCSDELRSGAYELNSFRTNSLLKLRKYLNGNVLNQIPQLELLKRFVEELNVSASMGSGTSLFRASAKPSSLSPFTIVDLEVRLLDKLMSDEHLRASPEPLSREELIEIATKLSEEFEPVESIKSVPSSDVVCCVCNRTGEHRCSACKSVVYCGRDCQIKDWNRHKQTCRNA